MRLGQLARERVGCALQDTTVSKNPSHSTQICAQKAFSVWQAQRFRLSIRARRVRIAATQEFDRIPNVYFVKPGIIARVEAQLGSCARLGIIVLWGLTHPVLVLPVR